MKAPLVVSLLLNLIGNASAFRVYGSPGISPDYVWSHIGRNAADIKKNKENVDIMKQGFASQTMLMAEMTTSIDEMRDAIE